MNIPTRRTKPIRDIHHDSRRSTVIVNLSSLDVQQFSHQISFVTFFFFAWLIE